MEYTFWKTGVILKALSIQSIEDVQNSMWLWKMLSRNRVVLYTKSNKIVHFVTQAGRTFQQIILLSVGLYLPVNGDHLAGSMHFSVAP